MATRTKTPAAPEAAETTYDETIQMCIDRPLPPEMQAEAARVAIAENPANVPVVHFRPEVGVGNVPVEEIAVLVGKRWQNGRTLRVRFLDGDPVVQQKLQPFAHQWSEFANITFEFGNDPDAEIRISFRDRGRSWSNLGTDALLVARNQPTMNYGWLTPNSTTTEYSRVVIHEFGHALGCIHEHQNPSANIPWDREAVYRYYGGPPNNWTRAMVDTNLFRRYSADQTNFSAFDPDSIMLYAIDNALTVGDFEVGWNTVLSQTDKQFIGTVYPKTQGATNALTIGGPEVQAAIGAHGEVDRYTITVAEAGRYRISTSGPTDVVMGLFGPNNETTLVAEDDDSGVGRNAMIVKTLQPGTYHLRVRHFRPSGTGAYGISVQTVP